MNVISEKNTAIDVILGGRLIALLIWCAIVHICVNSALSIECILYKCKVSVQVLSIKIILFVGR